MLEERLAAEVLIIGVLHPALAQYLVGEIVSVLEDRQPCHQACRQRRPAGAVLIDRAEVLLQETPVDGPRQLRQRVFHVDDLVEPRAEQLLLAGLAPLAWLHGWPPRRLVASTAENHSPRFEGIRRSELQENRRPEPQKRRNRILGQAQSAKPIRSLGFSSRTLLSATQY